MLAQTPIGNRFYNWVNSQDPNRRYVWQDNCGCACALFLQEEMGLSRDEALNAFQSLSFPYALGDVSNNKEAKEVWNLFNILAYGGMEGAKAWTFGALAERIRAKYPEFV